MIHIFISKFSGMKRKKIRRRGVKYFIILAAATVICWDISVVVLKIHNPGIVSFSSNTK